MQSFVKFSFKRFLLCKAEINLLVKPFAIFLCLLSIRFGSVSRGKIKTNKKKIRSNLKKKRAERVRKSQVRHVVPGVVVCLMWCIMVGRVNARKY